MDEDHDQILWYQDCPNHDNEVLGRLPHQEVSSYDHYRLQVPHHDKDAAAKVHAFVDQDFEHDQNMDEEE